MLQHLDQTQQVICERRYAMGLDKPKTTTEIALKKFTSTAPRSGYGRNLKYTPNPKVMQEGEELRAKWKLTCGKCVSG